MAGDADRDPAPGDDPLAGLRRLGGLAKELGITDVAAFTQMLDAAREQGRGSEVFKPLKDMVDQFAGSGGSNKTASDLGSRLMGLVSGGRDGARESVGDRQRKVETALLRRIEELSATASIEGVLDLATAYARLCWGGIAPSERVPEERRAGGASR